MEGNKDGHCTFYYEALTYQIAMLTTLLAWVLYIVTANLMVKAQKLF